MEEGKEHVSQQPDPTATPIPLLPPSPIPQLDGEVGFQPITTPELRRDSLHHRGSPPRRASSPRRGSPPLEWQHPRRGSPRRPRAREPDKFKFTKSLFNFRESHNSDNML